MTEKNPVGCFQIPTEYMPSDQIFYYPFRKNVQYLFLILFETKYVFKLVFSCRRVIRDGNLRLFSYKLTGV